MVRKISTSGSWRSRLGFSLIELLVVVAILVILASIGIGAYIKVAVTGDQKQSLVTLQNVRLKLEEYASDHNGIYPVGSDSSSAAVYCALSGDPTGQGLNPTQPVYWSELNNRSHSSLVGEIAGGRKVICDGYQNTIRYRAGLDGNGNTVDQVRSDGGYDLWSTGRDGEPADLNTPGTFINEQTADDIWVE